MNRPVSNGTRDRSAPPRPNESDISVHIGQLRILLVGGILAAALVGFFSLFVATDSTLYVPVASAVNVVGFIVLLVLLQVGRVASAQAGLIALGYGTATAGMFLAPGTAVTGAVLYLIVLLFAALFLGRRATLTMSALIVVTLGIAYLLENSGVIDAIYPEAFTPAAVTYAYVVMILAVCLQTALLLTTVDNMMKRSQQIASQADSLQSQNVRLAEAQLSLKRQTDQLEQANRRLQEEMQQRQFAETALIEAQKLESLGLLAGGIAHDFNNLLTGVISQGELALLKLGADHAAANNIEKSLISAQNAADLTRQLLTYAGRGKIEPEILDLNSVIASTRDIIANGLRPGIRVEYQLLDDVAAIHMDRAQLQQILMNLVLNAADAIVLPDADAVSAARQEVGDVSPIPHIVVRTLNLHVGEGIEVEQYACPPRACVDYACLDVSDVGHGIDEATLKRIFDPFFSTKDRGHGLGLSAVMGIVRSVGGALKVESAPQAGTRFLIMLPAVDGPNPDAVPRFGFAGSITEEQTDAPLNGRTILVIDDDERVRMSAVDVLQVAGAATLSAAGGREGIQLFHAKQAEIHAVLLDVRMPEMDGPSVLRYLRDIAPQTPIVLVSGYAERTDVSSLVEPGEVLFLAKPYSVDQLVGVFCSLLNT